MAGGYKAPRDGMEKLTGALSDQRERLRELERPTGTSYASLVDWVRQTLANITAQVNTIATNWMAANAYTKAQVDSKVANPGNISPGNVSASGTISGSTGTFPTGVNSVGVYNNLLTSAYRVQYVWSGGDMGYVPSSRRFKEDITDAPDVKAAMLAMRVVTFRYKVAVEELGDDAAVEWGVIAEELHGLGLHWAVDYDDEGLPFGVKYERLALACIPVIQDHELRLQAAGL